MTSIKSYNRGHSKRFYEISDLVGSVLYRSGVSTQYATKMLTTGIHLALIVGDGGVTFTLGGPGCIALTFGTPCVDRAELLDAWERVRQATQILTGILPPSDFWDPDDLE